MDTIFALSSGRPPAAIAIVRISGPQAVQAAGALAGRLPPPRTAALRTLRDPAGAPLDRALVLVFPGPATATGEDLVELHLHGGRAVVRAVEACLAAMPALRRATAGEFTRRALANGRIDLAQAQGLADLLEAETDTQRKAAFAAVEGAISRAVREWLDRIADLSALVESALDFSDEDDVAPVSGDTLEAALSALATDIREILERPSVDRLRQAITVVLAGPPNAGKSSLFNALLERDAAIVTSIAGTTRDVLEADVLRNGIAYRLIDTAGVRTETSDPIEQIGIERANRVAAGADILLWLGEQPHLPANALLVHARADEPGRASASCDAIGTSIHESATIARVWNILQQRATAILPDPSTTLFHEHQYVRLAAAASELDAARMVADLLIVAEHLRRARVPLAQLLGVDATEVMLGALFGRFCIGK